MRLKNVCLLLPISLLAACGAHESADSSAHSVSAEEVLASADSVSFSSDVSDINSPSRKVIRTADFRCRVDDVFTASTSLEHTVKSLGGIVEESRMANSHNYSKDVYYKSDSVKQVQTYTTTSYLTLRVPAASLDSVVKAIPELATFIEHRTLLQNDVTLMYLSNALKNKTGANNTKAMDLAQKSKDAIAADEYTDGKKERNIDRSIENLRFLDNANYATIKVEFFQPERVNTEIVINPEYYAKPAYGVQFTLAMSRGWQLLKEVLLVIVTIWPLWLAALATLVIYRKFRKPLWVR